MAKAPKTKLGIQTVNNEFAPATAPRTSETFKKKIYTNIKLKPNAKLTPEPPLRFLKAKATAIIVRM